MKINKINLNSIKIKVNFDFFLNERQRSICLVIKHIQTFSIQMQIKRICGGPRHTNAI